MSKELLVGLKQNVVASFNSYMPIVRYRGEPYLSISFYVVHVQPVNFVVIALYVLVMYVYT